MNGIFSSGRHGIPAAARDRAVSAHHPAASRFSGAMTLIAMSLGYGVVQLDVTIVNTALGSISATLGGGVAELQWVVSAYTVAFAALILTAGALGDRIGAKRVFIGGFALFTAASVGCAAAPNALVLILLRSLQGVAAAMLVPNSLALLNHAYPEPKARARAVAVWAAGASLALTAGPFVGGTLIALTGWRAIFLVNLPLGLAGLWLTLAYTQDTPRREGRALDLPGQLAAIAALGVLAAALIAAGERGWSDRLVMAGIAVAIMSGMTFVRREMHTPQPMLPLSLFGNRVFAASALVGLLVNTAIYGLIFVFSLYFQQIDGLSPFATGLAFVPMLAVVLPVNLLAPAVAERFGAPATIAAGAVLSAIGCLALLGIAPGTGYAAIGPQLVALSSGLGLLVPPLTSTLLGSVEKSRAGLAAAVLNAMRQTGSVLGVALFGSLIGRSGAFIAGMRLSLLIAALVLLAAAAAVGGGRSMRAAH